MYDYRVVSPSLEGVLSHGNSIYENLKRPVEIMRIFDGPSAKGRSIAELNKSDQNILGQYLNDLSDLYSQKFREFCTSISPNDEEIVRLQAIFQEIVRVRNYLKKH